MRKEIFEKFEKYINIEEIYGDIIKTKDNRYLTIIEIEPINFEYKTNKEQSSILSQFEKYLRIAPIKFQIKTLSRRTDVEDIIKKIEKDFEEYGSPELKELEEDQIQLVRRIGGTEGVEREFFLILEYCPTDGNYSKNIEDIEYWFDRAKTDVKKYLHYCGNDVKTFKTQQEKSSFLLETLFKILNKNKTSEDMYKKIKLLYSKAEEYYDYDEEALEEVELPYKNVIAPDKINFFTSYCSIDGTYYTFLYLPADSYHLSVAPAWISGLVNAGEGVDLDIFVQREDSSEVRKSLRTRLRVNKARIKNMEDTGVNYEEVSKSLESGDFIKNSLANGEFFYYVSTMITISGESFEDMYSKYLSIKNFLDANDLEARECEYAVDKAFNAYMPFNNFDSLLSAKAKRNVMSRGLSAFYPFVSYRVSDSDGILYGINSDNDSMCLLDNFDTHKYKNANMAVLGTTGAGKTFAIGIMSKRYRLKGIQTFVILPIKGHEFRRVCDEVDGEFIKISSGSKNRINIMEIRPTNDENSRVLGIEDDEEEIILNKKIDSLLIFFSLMITDMTIEERQLLDEAIITTYAQKGITKDNSSLIDHLEFYKDEYGNQISKPVYKEMPIFEDLYNVLRQEVQTARLATILKKYVTGSASSFNGQTNVNLDNKYVVIDISNLSDELLPIGMFIALDFIWDKAKEDITKKKAIFIDETWVLMKDSELAAKFTVEIFKVIRGYGGAAIAATQDINDFFALKGGEYGKAIISNSKTKLVLNLESEEAETVSKILNLSEAEENSIKEFEQGQMLVVSNSNTFPLTFIASQKEMEMMTTDRTELAKIAKKRKKLAANFQED